MKNKQIEQSFKDKVAKKIKEVESKFNQAKATAHLDKLLKFYGIEVTKWSTGAVGRAYGEKKIKIPHPTNTDRFCVGMHEIKHIIDGLKGKVYENEYNAEMFAIDQAELLGFDASPYRERARRYIIMFLAKAHNRKLNFKNIKPEIIKFCNYDFSGWQGKKVYVENWGFGVEKGLPLKITLEGKTTRLHVSETKPIKPEQDPNTQLLLDQINSPVEGSPIEFVLQENQTTPTLIVFEAKIRRNMFLSNDSITGFTDYYFITLEQIFKSNGYAVGFNNTGRVFWVSKIKKLS